jgi:hypothetical protein
VAEETVPEATAATAVDDPNDAPEAAEADASKPE